MQLRIILFNYEGTNSDIGAKLLEVLFELVLLINFFYLTKEVLVGISLKIRSLRDAEARWQCAFINIINPFGLLIILLIPLRKSNPTNEIIKK